MDPETQRQLEKEDEEYWADLRRLVDSLRKKGASEERVQDAIYFFGGPPSDCYAGRCNCPMH